jgi:hypothetical protein
MSGAQTELHGNAVLMREEKHISAGFPLVVITCWSSNLDEPNGTIGMTCGVAGNFFES